LFYQSGVFPLESDTNNEEALILVPLDDQDLVRPEVLARDKEKWEQTQDAKRAEPRTSTSF